MGNDGVSPPERTGALGFSSAHSRAFPQLMRGHLQGPWALGWHEFGPSRCTNPHRCRTTRFKVPCSTVCRPGQAPLAMFGRRSSMMGLPALTFDGAGAVPCLRPGGTRPAPEDACACMLWEKRVDACEGRDRTWHGGTCSPSPLPLLVSMTVWVATTGTVASRPLAPPHQHPARSWLTPRVWAEVDGEVQGSGSSGPCTLTLD